MKQVDCKELKRIRLEELANNTNGEKVKLVVIQVGNNPESTKYVNQKKKAGELSGIEVEHISLNDSISESELAELVKTYNEGVSVHGLIIQLPLPDHIDEDYITNLVNPLKDVDGLTDVNLGRIAAGKPYLVPCTAKGVMTILDSVMGLQNIGGKKAVILGRSKLVGLPLMHLLMQSNATVTVCHSKTVNTEEYLKDADIIVTATGSKKPFINADMIKEGAVVIDVTTTFNEKLGKLTGDVIYSDVVQKAGYVTPVPGGVGQLTVLELMNNTYKAYLNQKQKVYKKQ